MTLRKDKEIFKSIFDQCLIPEGFCYKNGIYTYWDEENRILKYVCYVKWRFPDVGYEVYFDVCSILDIIEPKSIKYGSAYDIKHYMWFILGSHPDCIPGNFDELIKNNELPPHLEIYRNGDPTLKDRLERDYRYFVDYVYPEIKKVKDIPTCHQFRMTMKLRCTGGLWAENVLMRYALWEQDYQSAEKYCLMYIDKAAKAKNMSSVTEYTNILEKIRSRDETWRIEYIDKMVSKKEAICEEYDLMNSKKRKKKTMGVL